MLKTANVQWKTLKVFQKSKRTITEYHFLKSQDNLAPWIQNIKQWRVAQDRVAQHCIYINIYFWTLMQMSHEENNIWREDLGRTKI